MTSPLDSAAEQRLKLLTEMLETNPEDSFLHYASALEYRKLGKLSKAIEILENLRSNDPDYLGTYFQLGKLYEDVGEIEAALSIYRSGLTVAQQQSDHKTLGELSEAVVLIED